MGFWNKKINKKNITKLSNEIGVEEEKIKELVKGEREISGETMDKVLNVLNEDKIQNAIEKQEIMKWYYETDLSELRKSFGYSKQNELANELKCHPASICNLENHKDRVKQISPLIEQLYYFYKNDFNKKSNKKLNIEQDEKTIKKINEFKKHNENKKTIYYWYATNDLKKLREDKGILTQKELAKITNLPQSTVSDFENKRFKTCNSTIITLYNFYNNKQEKSEANDDDYKIYEWYINTDIKKLRKDFGYSLNKFMLCVNISYDQLRDFENHNYKKVNPTLKKLYNFYMNEENNLNSSITNVSPISVDEVSEVVEEDIEEVEEVFDKDKYFPIFLEQEEKKEEHLNKKLEVIQSTLINSLERLNSNEYMNGNFDKELDRSENIIKTVELLLDVIKINNTRN